MNRKQKVPPAIPKPPKSTQRRRARWLKAYRRRVHNWILWANKGICFHCFGWATQTHHVYRKGTSPEDWREHPNSIIPLCLECHDAIENRGTISKEELVEDLRVAIARRPRVPSWVVSGEKDG